MDVMLDEWFARYVDADVDGLKQNVTGSGQMRPVGAEWDDARPTYFVPGMGE